MVKSPAALSARCEGSGPVRRSTARNPRERSAGERRARIAENLARPGQSEAELEPTMTFRANVATEKDGDEEASDPWDDDGDSDDKDGGTPDRDDVTS